MSIMDRFSVVGFPWGRGRPGVEDIVRLTRHAERLGFYSMSLATLNGLPRTGPFRDIDNDYLFDEMVLLPLMVQATNRIRIGMNSIPVPLLPPFKSAKFYASLDVLSGGRVIAGMCLCTGKENFTAVSLEQKYRGKMADEALEIITRLWTEDEVSYQGRFNNLEKVRFDPKPIQKPYPPIWWGGRAVSIPRTVKYRGEYLAPPWPSIEELETIYVPRLAEENERMVGSTKIASFVYANIFEKDQSKAEVNKVYGPYLTIEFEDQNAFEVLLVGSAQQVAEKIQAFMQAGVSHFILDFSRHGIDSTQYNIEQLDAFVEEVVPLLT